MVRHLSLLMWGGSKQLILQLIKVIHIFIQAEAEFIEQQI